MEATSSLSSAATIVSSSSSSSSSSSPLSFFSPKKKKRSDSSSHRFLSLSKKDDDKDYDPKSDSKSSKLVPRFQNRFLSNDEAMGLVLNAASVSGWTTGSGMEGPSLPSHADTDNVSTLPWSLFTKSPRRRMRVAFTCNVCGQRTMRAINAHAYTDGTVFVQCCGCNVFHKLVDNLNLFHEVKYYVSSATFNYRDAKWDVTGLNLFDDDNNDGNDGKDLFPL